jgi:hypothetical protein
MVECDQGGHIWFDIGLVRSGCEGQCAGNCESGWDHQGTTQTVVGSERDPTLTSGCCWQTRICTKPGQRTVCTEYQTGAAKACRP